MSSEPSPTAPSGRSGLLLAVAMGLGNLLSYVFVLILTRSLGREGFGAYQALITLGIVLVIPAGAFQVVIARRWAKPELRTSGVRVAAVCSLALTAVTIAASPAVDVLFHLHGISATVAMSLMLAPMTMTGAFQGVLLGSGRVAQLALLYVVTAGTRVVGALICAHAHIDVTGVFLMMALAAALAAVYGWWAARPVLLHAPGHRAGLVVEMIRSNSTLAAFTALTNVDVVLVRHFLSSSTSGAYALTSTFARAMCWGTQFLALLIVPRLAGHGDAGSGRRALYRSAALICTLGALASGGIVALGADRIVEAVGGHAFAGQGDLVVGCLGLGTVWALAQLWLFSQMADDDMSLGTLAWAMVGLELVGGWVLWHERVWQVMTLAAICSGAVVIAGIARSRTHRVTVLEDQTDLLALEHV